MPRQSRLDAPGLLHHVMIRGIERKPIFANDQDRDALVDRLSLVLPETQAACYGGESGFSLQGGSPAERPADFGGRGLCSIGAGPGQGIVDPEIRVAIPGLEPGFSASKGCCLLWGGKGFGAVAFPAQSSLASPESLLLLGGMRSWLVSGSGGTGVVHKRRRCGICRGPGKKARRRYGLFLG